jgi:peptidoglycan/LPS O-acetylase OafA/YrhL
MVNIWLGLVLLLTPTGTLPSPRWRWWPRVTVATLVALVVVVPLPARPAGRLVQPVDSPQDLHAFGGVLLVAYQDRHRRHQPRPGRRRRLAGGRFRHARGIERQQLRWVALATVVLALLIVVVVVALAQGAFALAGLTGSLCLVILPVAVGAAILRYRLYDLDRIISRTLAYAVLTLLLGLGYAGVVLGLGRLLPQGSSLLVAAATLAVAAVFQPARRRIQRLVDRRFDRRRYDAARTIQGSACDGASRSTWTH